MKVINIQLNKFLPFCPGFPRTPGGPAVPLPPLSPFSPDTLQHSLVSTKNVKHKQSKCSFFNSAI